MSGSHTHPTPLSTLAPYLLPHLPNSLPLLRRLQFHASSPSALTFVTFPPTTPHPPPSFAATYVDRARAPETECWIFSTYETTRAQAHDGDGDEAANEAKSQLLALLSAISRISSSNHNPILVIGTLSERLLPLLGSEGLVATKVVTRDLVLQEEETRDDAAIAQSVLNGISVPYMKWLIPPPPSPSPSQPPHLPANYDFTTLPPSSLPVVIARTHIPKTVTTLAQLGSVGIRYHPPSSPKPQPTAKTLDGTEPDADEAELIAWAFITTDGSLSTLHVEPAHRGLGLAKAVARRLFARLAAEPAAMGFRSVGSSEDPSAGLAHSDVAVENVESAGVVRALGGKEGWLVRWVSVDLGRVEGVVRGMGLEMGA